MNTPKIRSDLKATPAEDQGIKYFDVSDPRSGSHMRLYDFEWLVAAHMDGARRFDELADWARAVLGIQPSARDLEEFARRLSSLGFFEMGAGDNSQEVDLRDEVTPLPAAMPGMSGRASGGDAEPEIEVEAPPEPVRAETRNETPTLRGEAPVLRNEQPTLRGEAPVLPSREPPVQEAPLYAAEPPRTPGASTGRMSTPPEPKKGSSGSLVVLLILLVLGGAGVAYWKFFMPPAAAKVTVAVVSPREVVRLYDGAGTVKKADASVLSFGEAGKVSMVAEKGAHVKADEPVAKLEAFDKIEKELVDVKDRLGFYEKQLTAARAKNDESAAKTAEGKVAEKTKLLGELEAKAHKARLTAPSSGVVTEVMVKTGDDVKSGAQAVKIADERLTAEFKLAPADASTLKAGTPVTLQPAAGGATLSGRVARSEAGAVEIEVADDAAKPGAALRLVKAKVPNVVPVPLAAVVKRDGADTVFVLSEGKAVARKVNVADRTATEALVSSGLSAGDSVITSGVDQLQDGQAASTQ